MSTEMYLVCMSHTPHIESGVVGIEGRLSLPEIHGYFLHREELISFVEKEGGVASDDFGNPFKSRAALFLYNHKSCKIGIRDEYDHYYSMDDTGESDRRAALARSFRDILEQPVVWVTSSQLRNRQDLIVQQLVDKAFEDLGDGF